MLARHLPKYISGPSHHDRAGDAGRRRGAGRELSLQGGAARRHRARPACMARCSRRRCSIPAPPISTSTQVLLDRQRHARQLRRLCLAHGAGAVAGRRRRPNSSSSAAPASAATASTWRSSCKEVFGYKLKIVLRLQDQHRDQDRARARRGRRHASPMLLSSLNQTDWLAKKLVRVIVQHGSRQASRACPTCRCCAISRATDAERQMIDILNVRDEITRPYLGAARHSGRRVLDILRRAFDATVRDPAFLADVQRQQLEVEGPSTGEELAAVVEKLATHVARGRPAARRAVQQLQMSDSERMRHFAVGDLAPLHCRPALASRCWRRRRSPAQDFYRGKTLTILVGFSPGGGFDINARVLARHIGRHIPGNPDRGGAEHAGRRQPHGGALSRSDGPEGRHRHRHFQLRQYRRFPPDPGQDQGRLPQVQLDRQHQPGPHGLLCVAHVRREDARRPQGQARGSIWGCTGMGTSSDTNQRILKNIFGVRIQQVAGYPGSAEQRIAIERGELDGDCGAWSSIPQEWIEGRKIVPVIRSAPIDRAGHAVRRALQRRHRAERARPAGHAHAAGVGAGRPAVHRLAGGAGGARAAFSAMPSTPPCRTRSSLPRLQKLRLPISPKTGEEALKVVEEIYATPDDIVAAARKVTAE